MKRRSYLSIGGEIPLTRPNSLRQRSAPAELVDKPSQFQQIHYPDQRPMPAQNNLWIGNHLVCPLRAYRVNHAFVRL